MTVNKENNNGSLSVSIIGRIDTTTAPALEDELKSSFDGCSDLTLDFAKVDYISSAGLRVLLSAQKIMASRMTRLQKKIPILLSVRRSVR